MAHPTWPSSPRSPSHDGINSSVVVCRATSTSSKPPADAELIVRNPFQTSNDHRPRALQAAGDALNTTVDSRALSRSPVRRTMKQARKPTDQAIEAKIRAFARETPGFRRALVRATPVSGVIRLGRGS
jgi:hypothetical protein